MAESTDNSGNKQIVKRKLPNFVEIIKNSDSTNCEKYPTYIESIPLKKSFSTKSLLDRKGSSIPDSSNNSKAIQNILKRQKFSVPNINIPRRSYKGTGTTAKKKPKSRQEIEKGLMANFKVQKQLVGNTKDNSSNLMTNSNNTTLTTKMGTQKFNKLKLSKNPSSKNFNSTTKLPKFHLKDRDIGIIVNKDMTLQTDSNALSRAIKKKTDKTAKGIAKEIIGVQNSHEKSKDYDRYKYEEPESHKIHANSSKKDPLFIKSSNNYYLICMSKLRWGFEKMNQKMKSIMYLEVWNFMYGNWKKS